jgi:bacterial/archaeal transporter family-2 protein
MRTLFMLIAVLAGAALPIQASINAEFAQRGATVLWSAAISASLTALTLAAVAILVLRTPPPSLSLFAAVPPWLWWGGFLGVVVLGVMSWLPHRIGAAMMIVCFIAGQTLCALVLDHFGALGLPQQDLTPGRLLGALLIVGGVMLVRFL